MADGTLVWTIDQLMANMRNYSGVGVYFVVGNGDGMLPWLENSFTEDDFLDQIVNLDFDPVDELDDYIELNYVYDDGIDGGTWVCHLLTGSRGDDQQFFFTEEDVRAQITELATANGSGNDLFPWVFIPDEIEFPGRSGDNTFKLVIRMPMPRLTHPQVLYPPIPYHNR